MCRAGGRRCPGQYDPAKAAARNAQRRANYAAKKGKGSEAPAGTPAAKPAAQPENITLTGKALRDEEFKRRMALADLESKAKIAKAKGEDAESARLAQQVEEARLGHHQVNLKVIDEDLAAAEDRQAEINSRLEQLKGTGNEPGIHADQIEAIELQRESMNNFKQVLELQEEQYLQQQELIKAGVMEDPDADLRVSEEDDAEYERINAYERAEIMRDNPNAKLTMGEPTRAQVIATLGARNLAEAQEGVRETEKDLKKAEEDLKVIKENIRKKVVAAQNYGIKGQAADVRAETKPALDQAKKNVKDIKAALKEAKDVLRNAQEEEDAAKENLSESADWVKQAREDEYYHGLDPNATAASLESTRKARESAEQNYQEAVERDKAAESELSNLTEKKNYISGEEVKMPAYESSSAGYTYKNPVPTPGEMRRSVPAGVSFQEAVAPGDYVRHLGEYVKVDSYAVTERGITVNEGEDTETFIPINDWHDGGVLLRSRPGTNDGDDYNEDDHFDEPELRRVGDGPRGSNGYDEDYDDLYAYEDDGFPEDDMDFSDDLDPADLGDPYGDRDYGDDY